MARTKTNTKNNTKTCRTPRRNRHLEKAIKLSSIICQHVTDSQLLLICRVIDPDKKEVLFVCVMHNSLTMTAKRHVSLPEYLSANKLLDLEKME